MGKIEVDTLTDKCFVDCNQCTYIPEKMEGLYVLTSLSVSAVQRQCCMNFSCGLKNNHMKHTRKTLPE